MIAPAIYKLEVAPETLFGLHTTLNEHQSCQIKRKDGEVDIISMMD